MGKSNSGTQTESPTRRFAQAYNDSYLSLTYSSNQPPSSNLEASPSSGISPLLFTLDSKASDPGGNIVQHKFDFDGNGTIDEITTSNTVINNYISPRIYNATVKLLDDDGARASDAVFISVSPLTSPIPTRTPIPTRAPYSRISDAPLEHADDTIVTVSASGCDNRTIRAAINASTSGWTGHVKKVDYAENIDITSKNCTHAQPCRLQALSGHTP